MSQDTVAVPVATLREILSRCVAGISPTVQWSESRPEMDQQAMRRRKEALQDIKDQVEELLPANLQ